MAIYDIVWTAPLDANTTASAGQALVPTGNGYYVLATSANRTTYGRTAGICLRNSDPLDPAPMAVTGIVDKTITGLGTGSASWVRVNASGSLERCTPSGSDDVVGYCRTDGTLHLICNVLTANIINGTGSGSGLPPGWYDVQADGGAVGDDATDDTTSIQTLINTATATAGAGATIYFPPGSYYCADNLYVTRTVVMMGAGPGTSRATVGPSSTIRFAAGKGLIVLPQWTAIGTGFEAYAGGFATDSHIVGLHIQCAPITLTARGGTAAVGDKIKSPRLDDNRYFFECLQAGSTAVSVPDFRGAYQPYIGTTLPASSSAIKRGQQVHDMTVSTTVFWECTVAGTRGSTASNALFTGSTTPGNTVADGAVTWTCRSAAGYFLTDDGVVWACRTAPGVWIQTRCVLEDVFVEGATNAGILAQPPLNCNQWKAIRPKVYNCGAGIVARGLDASQGTIQSPYVEYCGYDATWSGSTGGVAYWDGSFTGCQWYSPEAQACTGRGFLMGSYDQDLWISDPASLSPASAWVITGGYLEGCLAPWGNKGQVLGWNSTEVWNRGYGTLFLGQPGCQNVSEYTGGTYTERALMGYPSTSTVFAFAALSEDTAYLGWTYRATNLAKAGWWSLGYNDGTRAGFSVAGTIAAEGPGWNWQPYGVFQGGRSGVFTGQYFRGLDVSTMHDNRLRSPESAPTRVATIKKGDRWDVQWDNLDNHTGWIATNDGYGGYEAWQAGFAYTTSYSVEPTATWGYPSTAGGQVWKCTTGGTSGGVEPSWPGSPTPGVTTVADGTVTWTYVGEAPRYERIGAVDRVRDGTSSNGSTVNLDFVMAATRSYLLRLEIIGSRTETAATRGAEVHQIVAYTSGGSLTISNDTTLYGPGLPAGWGIAVSATGSTLRVAVNGAAGQTVKFRAKLVSVDLEGV